MIKLIGNVEDLRSIYSADKGKNKCGDIVNGKLVRAYACTTNPLMFITKNGEKIVSNEWFVNHNDELIYNIEKNHWVNMDNYSNGKSSVTDQIYYLEMESADNKSMLHMTEAINKAIKLDRLESDCKHICNLSLQDLLLIIAREGLPSSETEQSKPVELPQFIINTMKNYDSLHDMLTEEYYSDCDSSEEIFDDSMYCWIADNFDLLCRAWLTDNYKEKKRKNI